MKSFKVFTKIYNNVNKYTKTNKLIINKLQIPYVEHKT